MTMYIAAMEEVKCKMKCVPVLFNPETNKVEFGEEMNTDKKLKTMT
jgi:hypothetical protein